MKRRRLSVVQAWAALFVCSFASGAFAQSLPQAVVAQGLYEQALAAMDRGDHAAACPMLEEALRLEPAALGAKLTLAACYEGADRLASAWGLYGTAEHEAATASQEERRSKAHDHVAALQPRLAYLVVEVPDEVARLPGLVIKRDGVPVGPGQWGVPLPADRGAHLLEIQATGRVRVVRRYEILANGVTGKAVIAAPPPANEALPWWSMPVPPAAPRLAPSSLRPLKAPPDRGLPTVEIHGGEGLALRRVGAPEESALCTAPCQEKVDAREGELFLAGEGFVPSDRFRLDDRLGAVTIRVSPATRAQRLASLTAIVVGGGALGCGLALPLVHGHEGSTPAALCLTGGLVSTIVGVVTLATNRTSLTIGRGGAAVFRF